MSGDGNILGLVIDAPCRTSAMSFLRAPFDAWAPERLLEHFRRRETVEYFPIIDDEECRSAKIEAILDNRFELNGESYELPRPVPWLDNPSKDREWHILLHKFYYAVGLGLRFHETGDARYLDKWIELTDSWVAVTPPGYIAADVTGRRIQNWIYAHYYFVTQCKAPQLPPTFYCRFLSSLSEQVDYLCTNLAPARNHRTLELYAIFLAAVVFPEMRGAARWLQFSVTELARNVATDLLPDGVQSELSTDYHHIVLRNFLCVRQLARLNDIAVPPEMDRALVKALEFSLHAHRPDGIVPSFSDGDARDYRALLHWGHELYGREDFIYSATGGARGTRPSVRSASFADSGYYVVRSGWGEREPFRDERYLMFDCGPLGAGNHGHFDLLSFEAYAYGQPLIVDPGRYTYSEAGETNWRARFRGTGSHNTVLVDGRDQTRYTPGRRKLKVSGPAPRHEMRACISAHDFDLLHGVAHSHEYPVVHERVIAFAWPEYWIVSDVLRGVGEHRYDLLFHLAHHMYGRVSLRKDRDSILIEAQNLVLAQCIQPGLGVCLEESFVSQRYGEKRPAPVVRASRQAEDAIFHSVLYPFRREAPTLELRELEVVSECGMRAGHRAQALAITITVDGQTVTDVWFFATERSPSGGWQFAGYSFDGTYMLLRVNACGELVSRRGSSGTLAREPSAAIVAGGRLT